MAGIKISALPAVPSALTTDFFPVVQGGVTSKETLAQVQTLFGFAGGILGLANGGTGANLTASNGGIVYSTATTFAILAGTATAGKVLQSGASGAPTWSTPTYPSTSGTAGKVLISDGTNNIYSTPTYPNTSGTAGKILRSDGTNNVYSTSTFADTYTASNLVYSNGANTITGLATANDGVLVTSNTGVPSILVGPGATGRYLQSNTALAPSWSSFVPATSGANSDITSMTGLTGKLQAPTAIASSTGLNALAFTYTASSVNYLTIMNNSTGNDVRLVATGSDAALNMVLGVTDGYVALRNSGTTTAPALRLYNAATTQYTGFKVADAAASTVTFTVPSADGSANFIMKTNGSAVLSLTNGSQIAGTATNDNASAGNIGEYISSSVLVGSAVSVTSGNPADVTSISLTAGDWDVTGTVISNPAAGTVTSQWQAWISQTSASAGTLGAENNYSRNGAALLANQYNAQVIGPMRISLSGTTTIYLGAQMNFTVNTMTVFGFIGARRVR